MRCALVHDCLVGFGGAEGVLGVLCELFPGAPIYTLLWERGEQTRWITEGRNVRTSFLQRVPGPTLTVPGHTRASEGCKCPVFRPCGVCTRGKA
jgi:hypothetical protein